MVERGVRFPLPAPNLGPLWPYFFMKKFLDGTQLKLGAAFLMVLDHLHFFWLGVPVWFNYLGRIVAPIFFFLIVEGFFKTRNRWRYLSRLTLAAIIMQGGSYLLNHYLPAPVLININIFWPLALSIALMMVLEELKKKNFVPLLLLIPIIFVFFFVEGGWLLMGVSLIFYYGRQRWQIIVPAFILLAVIFQLLYWYLGVGGSGQYQWLMIFSLPVIALYNGTRGWYNPALKYFFYIFYPLHIWLIYLIGLKYWY